MVTEGTLTWRNPDVKTEETDFRLAARVENGDYSDLTTANPGGGIHRAPQPRPPSQGLAVRTALGGVSPRVLRFPPSRSRTGWGLFPTAEAQGLTRERHAVFESLG